MTTKGSIKLTRTKPALVALGWLLGSMALSCLTGCQLVFAIAEQMFPTEKVPAQFELPRKQIVLVFPDDVERPLSYPPIKRRLAEEVSKLLTDKKIAAQTVPYDKIVELRAAEPDFNRLAVASVGRRLGASLVIYINIDEFLLKDRDTPTETLWHGKFSAKVRVVDVQEGRLWPDEREGFPVRIGEPITENSSRTYETQLSRKLADDLATQIAGLFHAHRVSRHRPKEPEVPFE